MIQSLWLMIAPENWYLCTAVYISDSLNITFKQSIYSVVGGILCLLQNKCTRCLTIRHFFILQNINHELQNETVKMDYRVQCTCIDLEPQKSYLLTQTINYAVFLTIKTINYGK